MPQQTTWQRRFRRLAVLTGTATTIYLLTSYALNRMREARVSALKDKSSKDLLKNHFTTLISTISFTLYALLPTLHPQLYDAYPVEATSQALQGLSVTPSSVSSVDPTPENTPANSLLLQDAAGDMMASSAGESSTSTVPPAGVEGSWASEFRPSEVGRGEETDDTFSNASQTISLPATDVSSSSESPISDVHSQLQPSPPRNSLIHDSGSPERDVQPPRTKKELWRDLKLHTLTRALTTAYLLPMLLLLTSSQLSTLARRRYLHDVRKASQPGVRAVNRIPTRKQNPSWFSLNYFSPQSMGLEDYVDEPPESSSAGLPFPFSALPSVVQNYLPFNGPAPARDPCVPEEGEVDEVERSEAERIFLTYSWWILNEGWKDLGKRVEGAVEKVFGSTPLKQSFSVEEWAAAIKSVREEVELTPNSGLYDFTAHFLPPSPLPATLRNCPLPTHPETSPQLMELLDEVKQQLASPDCRYILDKGVTEMVRRLLESLQTERYPGVGESRRLVDCLPDLNRWTSGVWEGIPDSGVEALLAVPEYENFAALIFGDWTA